MINEVRKQMCKERDNSFEDAINSYMMGDMEAMSLHLDKFFEKGIELREREKNNGK